MRTNNARRMLLLACVLTTALTGLSAQQAPAGRGRFDVPGPPRLTLASTSFDDLAVLPLRHTCLAKPAAVSPELHWTNVPDGTVSFAVMFHDLDPRVNKGINDTMHWMVWNIPASVTQLSEGMTPAQAPPGATQGRVLNRTGYAGPCMPPGGRPHHYSFDVYAVDAMLPVTAEGTRDDLKKALDGHILDHAMIVAYWARPLP